MSGDLCSLWRDFVSAPTDATLLERVRSVHADLLDHVDDCDTCLELSEKADPALLFDALGSIDQPLGAEDAETLRQMLSVSADDRKGICDAVQGALLPALPPALARLSDLGDDVDANKLFLALDAIRMFLKSSLRKRVPAALKTLAMRSDGTVVLNGEPIVPASVVQAEIRQYAGVKAASAGNLVRWIPEAARHLPHLIPGIDAEPRTNDGVWLRQVAWNATSGDLFDRWRPVSEAVEPALAKIGRKIEPELRRAVARANR